VTAHALWQKLHNYFCYELHPETKNADRSASGKPTELLCRLLQICACIVISDQLAKYIAPNAGILTYYFLLIIENRLDNKLEEGRNFNYLK
jgi:hypothetical protein